MNINQGQAGNESATIYKRLFVCIELPEFVKNALVGLETRLRGFRWTRPDNLHLTLKFIGEVDTPLADDITEALSAIRVEPFILALKDVGCFPGHRRPRITWVGAGGGHPRLFQLQGKVENTLTALGIEPEKRAYSPHITIARCAESSPETVRQLLKNNREFETAPFNVTEFALYRSELSPDGVIHTPEAIWKLS